MQQRILVVLALFVAPVCSTESSASLWLRSHSSPTDDQLGELKNANPDAYAMVKALLTKHSMGLVTLAPSEKGPDVFRRMMSHSDVDAHAQWDDQMMPSSYAHAQPIGDQMHYDPKVAADKDESMVSSLLEAVAGLAGKKGKKITLLNRHRRKAEDSNPLLEDLNEDSLADAPQASQSTQLMQAAAATMNSAAPPKKENSYLQGLDLSDDGFAEPTPAKQHVSDVSHHDTSADLLDSFSFGDMLPSEAEKPKPVVAPPKKDNSFLKWLGMAKKAPDLSLVRSLPEAPVSQKAAVSEMAEGNPYLAELE